MKKAPSATNTTKLYTVRGNPRTTTDDSSRSGWGSNNNVHNNLLRKKRRAFSLIEVVLAIALFSFFSLTSISILLYSEDSLANIGQTSRATNIAQEGIEASRAIKNEDFTLLADGDHGISSAGGKWQYAGAEDALPGFKRKINISTVDPNTKKIISTVSWQKRTGHDATLALETTLTNWSAYSGIPGFGDWTNPFEEFNTSLFNDGKDGVKIQVKGNNLYVVRDSAANSFASIDITDTKNPKVWLPDALNNLKDNPKNLAIGTNLAFIATKSNAAELQIADITNPNNPDMRGDFDARDAKGKPDDSDAFGVATVGNYVYLSKYKGNGLEFIVIDISNPDVPAQVGALELNASTYDIVILDHYAFVACDATSGQLKVIDIADPANPRLVGSANLPADQGALSIIGFAQTVLVGSNKGTVFDFDVSNPASPQQKGTFTLRDNNGSAINDMAMGLDNHYLFTVSNVATREFQVFDITNPAAGLFIGSFDTPNALTGVAYDNAKDRAFVTGVGNPSIIIFAPQ